MTDKTIAAVARRLAEALAKSAYERSDIAKMQAAALATELITAVRQETKQETEAQNETQKAH